MTLSALASLLLALAAPTALAESFHVSADATFDTVSPGGFQEVGCQIENTGTEPILARISPSVTYADGSVQTFRLNQPPTLIAPGETFILFIAFGVPEDAALGTATFSCDVRAVGSGGMGARSSATATFEVVAPS